MQWVVLSGQGVELPRASAHGMQLPPPWWRQRITSWTSPNVFGRTKPASGLAGCLQQGREEARSYLPPALFREGTEGTRLATGAPRCLRQEKITTVDLPHMRLVDSLSLSCRCEPGSLGSPQGGPGLAVNRRQEAQSVCGSWLAAGAGLALTAQLIRAGGRGSSSAGCGPLSAARVTELAAILLPPRVLTARSPVAEAASHLQHPGTRRGRRGVREDTMVGGERKR